MVMMAVKLLVKIAVMMMATAAFRRHRKRRGEGAPSSSSSLTSSLDGRRVSPLVLGLHGMGGARAPSRLDLFLRSCNLPFRCFLYIRRSVTPIGLKPSPRFFFFRKSAFLRPKKSSNRLTGGPQGSGARPLPRGPLGHLLALILLPIFHKYSKNILHPFLSHLDSV